MKIVKINDNSGKLYYVGGVVRDEILGAKSPDVDLIYEGNAIEWAKNQELNIIQVNEPFGTVRIKIDGQNMDIASTRRETYPRCGHLPEVSDIGCPLIEDVKRRDFTVNSLYKSVKTGEIKDFTGGLDDLKNKKLKVLHKNSFIDDPTRILRMLKFRMRFGFEPDNETLNLQYDCLDNINRDMSYKRVKKEIIELFDFGGKTKISKPEVFKIFVKEGIYKLITDNQPDIEEVNFNPKLIEKSHHWLIYGGLIDNIDILPLTKTEKKIIDDYNTIKMKNNLTDDIEIYRTFKNCADETVILYGLTTNPIPAIRYLDILKKITLFITGKDLIDLGLTPSKEFDFIFEKIICEKFKNPKMTKSDELKLAQTVISGVF